MSKNAATVLYRERSTVDFETCAFGTDDKMLCEVSELA